MALNLIDNGVNEPDDPWQRFLSAFGEGRDAVAQEIKQYWQSAGAKPFPVDVYKHLVENRIQSGSISRARGEFLNAYFAKSFAPGQVTGYIQKHREPLIYSALKEYGSVQSGRAIHHVEADIMNLGGLNRDMKLAVAKRKGWNPEQLTEEQKYVVKHEGEALANKVIRVMADILHEEVGALGDVIPIRHGGDELILFVMTKNQFDQYDVANAVDVAHQRISEFISEAGLDGVVHTKQEKLPGVGIGIANQHFAPVDHGGQSDYRAALEAAIDESKRRFQNSLNDRKNKTTEVSVAKVNEALNSDTFKRYAQPKPAQQPLLADDPDVSGSSPDDATKRRLLRHVEKLGDGALTCDERRLVEATSALCHKIDFVNGLPTFNAFQNEIAPYFEQHYGAKAKLVHVDFNNLGGGNKLGEMVGDAMSRVFRDCIQNALDHMRLDEFRPCLASQGGGKFVMLLPKETPQQALYDLQDEIEKQLFHRSQEKLLSQEQEAQVIEKLRKIDDEGRQKRANSGRPAEGATRRRDIFEKGGITIANISNLKSRQKGSHAICVFDDIALEGGARLNLKMDRLEERASRLQTTVAGLHERRFRIRKDNSNVAQKEEQFAEHYVGDIQSKQSLLDQSKDPNATQIYSKRGARLSWTREVKKADERNLGSPDEQSPTR